MTAPPQSSEKRVERINPEDPDESVRDVGWVVRGAGEKGRDAYFPDAVYEGSEAAYHAAVTWLSAAPDEDDTRNISRIDQSESEVWYELAWEGDAEDERFIVEEEQGEDAAFQAALRRLEEVEEAMKMFDDKPEALSIDVGKKGAVLRRKDEVIAEVKKREATQIGTRGYQVRLQRKKKQYSRYFADQLLGGEEGALKAAQYWRDVKKGTVPRGASSIPDTIEAVPSGQDPTRASSLANTQFGAPNLRIVFREKPDGHQEPFLDVRWPRNDGTFGVKPISIERHGVEDAVLQACSHLVKARRASTLTKQDLEKNVTPFDLVDGWHADKSSMSKQEEVAQLRDTLLPLVEEEAAKQIEDERRRREGLPGLSAAIHRSDEGHYAAFLQARWKKPDGEWTSIEEEVKERPLLEKVGEDEGLVRKKVRVRWEEEVRGALVRLCERMLLAYQQYGEKWKLRYDEASPFSKLEGRTPSEQVEHLVNAGLQRAKAEHQKAVEGVRGIRVAREKWETKDGPVNKCVVEVSWPSSSTSRRQRRATFNGQRELKPALEKALKRGLEALREGAVVSIEDAVGPRSPFQHIELQLLSTNEGFQRAVGKLARMALPSLRLGYQRAVRELSLLKGDGRA